MARRRTLSVSPSQLYDSTGCPNCYWNQRAFTGVRKPNSPFPQITNGIDRSMRRMFDKHRQAGTVPPCVTALGSGISPCADANLVGNKFVHTPDHLRVNDVHFKGQLDELLSGPNGLIVIDFKTKGSSNFTVFPGDPIQVAAYAHLLELNGHAVDDVGYLLLLWPMETDDDLEISFDSQWVEVDTSAAARQNARDLYENAAALISGPEPARTADCPWCQWKA